MSVTGFTKFSKITTVMCPIFFLAGCCNFCDTEKCCPEPIVCEECPAVEPSATNPDVTARSDDCECDKDIVYSFDIPTGQNNCKDGYKFTKASSSSPETNDQSGGAGVVDREGGAGVVDRDGNLLTAWCENECLGGAVGQPVIEWTSDSNFVHAKKTCN